MTEAVGPTFTGGFEHFVINSKEGEDYTILFLPDLRNDELQREGKAPVFYYMPEQVRIAKHGKNSLFHHTHFVGVQDETSVGIDAGEVQGGVLGFTTTSRLPTDVLAQAEQELLEKFSGKDEKYWGVRTRVAPNFRIVPISSNVTALSNITPNSDGAVPQQDVLPGAGDTSAGGNAAAGTGGAATGGGSGGTPTGDGGAAPASGGSSSDDFSSRNAPRYAGLPRDGSAYAPVPHGRDFRAPTQLEPWAWKMTGQGPGSVTGGENAYSGVLGPIPSEIVWAGFHGAYSPLVVVQNMMIPVWSQLMRIKITGDWNRIFTHFSAHANARYLWFSGDVKAEFNNMRMDGTIKVEVDVDGTMPGAQEMQRAIDQRIDVIVKQFTEQAKKVIFDPPTPTVQPAEAPSGGVFSSLFGGSAGLALKARFDQTQLKLNYEETRNFRYLQPNTISSSMKGFYDEIKNDPDAERKYFTRLVLGGLGRKVLRIVKPVVNWPDRTQRWVGQPVGFLSTQIGYPGEQGQIQWKASTFQATDAPDASWHPVFIERRPGEVTNPPQGWTPDQTFLKRRVHLLEPPSETESPFEKVFVEQKVIDLDPGPNGTLTNDNILEVRADSAGMLDLGPIALNLVLDAAQVIEVEFRAKGRRLDGTDRRARVTRFRFTSADQDTPRYWRIFTGQKDFVPEYEYRVNVTVRGTLFSKGQAWTGPWVSASGNGALMISVPGPTDPDVQTRGLTTREMYGTEVVRATEEPMQPATEFAEAPPAAIPAGATGVPGLGAPSAPGAPGAGVAPPRSGPPSTMPRPQVAAALGAPESGMPESSSRARSADGFLTGVTDAEGGTRDSTTTERLVLRSESSEPWTPMPGQGASGVPAPSTRSRPRADVSGTASDWVEK